MAPRSELVIFDGSDHGAHLTHPKEFADFVRSARARAAERSPGHPGGPNPDLTAPLARLRGFGSFRPALRGLVTQLAG